MIETPDEDPLEQMGVSPEAARRVRVKVAEAGRLLAEARRILKADRLVREVERESED